MFKGFLDATRSTSFKSFPSFIYRQNNSVYGFNGCSLWLNAAANTNTVTNLGAINLWASIINNYQFTQTTAGNQPQYTLSDASFNNLPTIRFQDSARRLYITNPIGLLPTSTIAWVGKTDTANANFNFVAGIGSTGTTNSGFAQMSGTSFGGNGVADIDGNSNFYGVSGGSNSTAPRIIIFTQSLIFINGVSQTTVGTRKFPNYSIGTIGGVRDTLSNFGLDGRLAEFMIFDRQFTSDDCTTLSTILNNKYAIY